MDLGNESKLTDFGDANWVNSSNFIATTVKFSEKVDFRWYTGYKLQRFRINDKLF